MKSTGLRIDIIRIFNKVLNPLSLNRRIVRIMLSLMSFHLLLITTVFAENNWARVSGKRFSIILKDTVTVSGDQVRLGDALKACSDAALKEYVKDVSLGKAPRPGREKQLRGSRIVSYLQTRKGLPNTVTVSVPKSIRVIRAHQGVSEKALKKVFHSYIASKLDGVDFKINRFSVRGRDKFPIGEIRYAVVDQYHKKVTGRVNVPVRVQVNGKDAGKIILSGWVDQYASVVCADRYLSRNTVLEAKDLRFKRINISKAPTNIIMDAEAAIGKRLKQSLKAGQLIRGSMLKIPPVVKKGDRVKIIAENGPLKIVTAGIAKDAGGIGEQIKVENITSQKTIVGRIRDASTVDILF